MPLYESAFGGEWRIEQALQELMCRVDSMEKSIKDTNKKITAIRNQLRKEKGRGDLS